MKIVNRNEFMTMPSGTLYIKLYDPDGYRLGPFLKQETIPNDWFYIDLGDFDTEDTEDYLIKKNDMIENGASVALNVTPERDGSYNDKDLFLIYERDDINVLKQLLSTADD